MHGVLNFSKPGIRFFGLLLYRSLCLISTNETLQIMHESIISEEASPCPKDEFNFKTEGIADEAEVCQN
jgi:hypothetical protein